MIILWILLLNLHICKCITVNPLAAYNEKILVLATVPAHHKQQHQNRQNLQSISNSGQKVREGPYVCHDSNLDCSFSTECRWRNGTDGVDDDSDWLIGDKFLFDNWHSIPRGRNGQGDLFTYTRGMFSLKHHADHRQDNTALLISDPINCQIGEGTLTFWYWKTAIHPTLLVCIRRPIQSLVGDNINCITSIKGYHGQEWIGETLKIPASTEPFQIIFEGKFLHTHDSIGLDDISYKATLCPCYSREFDLNMEDVMIFQEHYGREKFEERATDCDFDQGNLCAYDTQDNVNDSIVGISPGSTIKKWFLATKGQVGNSLTGVLKDSTGKTFFSPVDFGFLYADDTLRKQDTYLLKSKRFKVDSDANLTYFLYQAGVEGRFRLCLNDFNSCISEKLGKDIKTDARHWQKVSLKLSPETYQDRMHERCLS
uniref:MAM domain-containing protein n=1 Tax=Romanomermis culicivorax TaxID=13658 RepID=A0A915HVY4_ROMCU